MRAFSMRRVLVTGAAGLLGRRVVAELAGRCEVVGLDLARGEADIYPRFGLEWEWVRDAVRESFTDDVRRKAMGRSTNAFRVLIRTLLHAGIITDRTRHVYTTWVDMDELAAEDDEVAGADVAARAMEELKLINQGRQKMGSRFRPH